MKRVYTILLGFVLQIIIIYFLGNELMVQIIQTKVNKELSIERNQIKLKLDKLFYSAPDKDGDIEIMGLQISPKTSGYFDDHFDKEQLFENEIGRLKNRRFYGTDASFKFRKIYIFNSSPINGLYAKLFNKSFNDTIRIWINEVSYFDIGFEDFYVKERQFINQILSVYYDHLFNLDGFHNKDNQYEEIRLLNTITNGNKFYSITKDVLMPHSDFTVDFQLFSENSENVNVQLSCLKKYFILELYPDIRKIDERKADIKNEVNLIFYEIILLIIIINIIVVWFYLLKKGYIQNTL